VKNGADTGKKNKTERKKKEERRKKNQKRWKMELTPKKKMRKKEKKKKKENYTLGELGAKNGVWHQVTIIPNYCIMRISFPG
jgi:hypothetical protein